MPSCPSTAHFLPSAWPSASSSPGTPPLAHLSTPETLLTAPLSSLITIHNNWRVIFQVAAALIGLVLLLAILAFPETAYTRSPPSPLPSEKNVSTPLPPNPEQHPLDPIPKKLPYLSTLPLLGPSNPYTTEPLPLLLLRPLGLITFPPVLWAALVEASTIGFLVAMTSNVELAFQGAYGFGSWQVGLCFVAGVVGSLVGIPAGGWMAEGVADWRTNKRGG